MGLTRMPPIHSTYSLLDQDIPEITDRRRKIFLMRFVYGLSINHVSDRIHYQKNVIVDDSQSSLLQFANALSILVLKEQEISA
jgi:hypothetical protein